MEVRAQQGDWEAWVETDASGTYRFVRVRPGLLTLQASRLGATSEAGGVPVEVLRSRSEVERMLAAERQLAAEEAQRAEAAETVELAAKAAPALELMQGGQAG